MRRAINFLRDEPLVHFLVAGALVLFVNHFWISQFRQENRTREVVVSIDDQNRLAEIWRMQWGQSPSASEMEGLLASEVREQILYREAIALGLDKGDVIIRRRLVQKYNFLNENIANYIEPSQDELRSYFEQSAEDYRVPSKFTFSHIYFSPDTNSDPYARARAELAWLQAQDPIPVRAPEHGDEFPLQIDWSAAGLDQLQREFGKLFTDALSQSDLHNWQGPILSGLGVHLVYITARENSRKPDFGEVRDDVLRDFMYERSQLATERAYEDILTKYAVRIEGDQERVHDE